MRAPAVIPLPWTIDPASVETTAPASLSSGGSIAPRTRERAAAELGRGATIGRYLVLARLGAGGMGVVYAAYDPELDRKVAVKLLRSGGHDPRGRARLLREAQALAKLAHPNVVAVHDVGTVGAQIFVAMEFVEGMTLRRWLAARPRAWPEIVEVFVAVGRGLAAAHAAGLVHRDLKPDNVMVGSDGRARVMDFGLAHARANRELLADDPAEPADPDAGAGELTPTGALIGTPSYMSPEQWLGGEIDARSDQFSLCVALWEALYGARPFGGETWPALRKAVIDGRRREPGDPKRAPGWLRRVVERGLSTAPEERFGSVDALLEAIAAGQARARRGRFLAAATLVAGLVGGALGVHRLDQSQRLAACIAEGSEIRDALWSDEVKTALRAAFVGSGLEFGGATFTRVAPKIDAWIDAWAQARAQSCVDTEVHRSRAPELHALAVACLDEERAEVDALLTSLVEGGRFAVRIAPRAAEKLPRIESCQETTKLRRRSPLPDDPALRERALELRRELFAVLRLRYAGRYAEGLTRGVAALDLAVPLGYPPLSAELALQTGLLAIEAGRFDLAEDALARAYFEAGSHALDETAITAATELAYVVGFRLGRVGEALAWGRAAEMLVHRLGAPRGVLGANVIANLALVHRVSGELEEALALLGEALAIRERHYPAEDPNIAGALAKLAEVHLARGELGQASALAERAHELREKALGSDHPRVGVAHHDLARIRRAAGDLEGARGHEELALVILEGTVGPEHPDVGAVLLGLGELALARDQADEALAPLERAASIWREGNVRPDELAALRFALARALWPTPTTPARDAPGALRLARQAREDLSEGGAHLSGRLAAIDAWLADRSEGADGPTTQ